MALASISAQLLRCRCELLAVVQGNSSPPRSRTTAAATTGPQGTPDRPRHTQPRCGLSPLGEATLACSIFSVPCRARPLAAQLGFGAGPIPLAGLVRPLNQFEACIVGDGRLCGTRAQTQHRHRLRARRSLLMTGTPHAMASTTGMPNPSNQGTNTRPPPPRHAPIRVFKRPKCSGCARGKRRQVVAHIATPTTTVPLPPSRGTFKRRHQPFNSSADARTRQNEKRTPPKASFRPFAPRGFGEKACPRH